MRRNKKDDEKWGKRWANGAIQIPLVQHSPQKPEQHEFNGS